MKREHIRFIYAIVVCMMYMNHLYAQPFREGIIYYTETPGQANYGRQKGVATGDQGLLLAETNSTYSPTSEIYSKTDIRKLWGVAVPKIDISQTIVAPDNVQYDFNTTLQKDGFGNYYYGGSYYFNPTYLHDAVLIKYNSSLTEVWRAYKYSSSGSIGQNDYTLDVHYYSGNLYWLGYLAETGYFLCKISETGSQFFTINVSTFTPASVRVNAAGDIYLFGSSTAASGNGQIVLQKLNSSGVQVWKKTFNALAGVYADFPVQMELAATGDIYFTASCERTPGNQDAYLVKYNAAGTKQWSKYINGTSNLDDHGGKICFDPSGNIIVAHMIRNINLGDNNYDICLRKYNSAGTTMATRYYKGSGNKDDYPMDIFYAANGRFYLTGSTKVDNQNVKSVLAQYDQDLFLEYTDVMNHSYPVPLTASSSFIYQTGSVLDNAGLCIYWIGLKRANGIMQIDNVSAPFVIKYSLPAIPRLSGSSKAENEIKITVAPNPASSMVTIGTASEIDAVSVYDLSGRLMFDTVDLNKNELQLEVETWKPGVYVVRVVDAEGNLQTAKFIRE